MNKEFEKLFEEFSKNFDLNKLSEMMYMEAKNKGFHSDDEKPILANYLMNLCGEAFELWESYRKNQMNENCDKADKMEELGLEKLTCLEEELADVFIRTLDTSKALGVNLTRAVFIKMMFNRSRPFRNGNKLA